jgi:16S rRNA (adenine1518-N6/adenine1519-N6)-dimethyltransferase
MRLKSKKSLGQHFLINREACSQIACFLDAQDSTPVIEIGPGTGALTRWLLKKKFHELILVEFDQQAVDLLRPKLPLHVKLIQADILKTDWKCFGSSFRLIGNLPYNISSQILFKVYHYRHAVKECVFMLQQEVARRIVSPPGNRNYGILSVLMQTFFKVELLMTLAPEDFYPVPQVFSSVIRLSRNEITALKCDEKLFLAVIKSAFNQRRKMLRNALRTVVSQWSEENEYLNKRAEELSWQDFEKLTQLIKHMRSLSE